MARIGRGGERRLAVGHQCRELAAEHALVEPKRGLALAAEHQVNADLHSSPPVLGLVDYTASARRGCKACTLFASRAVFIIFDGNGVVASGELGRAVGERERAMANEMQASGRGRMIGWVLSGLAIAFLLMDATMKLLALSVVLETSGPLGFPGAAMARGLGVLLLACTLLYAAPQTAVLGAILLTDISAARSRRTFASAIRCSRTSCSACTSACFSGSVCICATRGCVRSCRCARRERGRADAPIGRLTSRGAA